MDFWSKYDILYTTVLIQEMIPEEFTFPSDTKYVMFTQQPWGWLSNASMSMSHTSFLQISIHLILTSALYGSHREGEWLI